jgi:hypothetical protein
MNSYSNSVNDLVATGASETGDEFSHKRACRGA